MTIINISIGLSIMLILLTIVGRVEKQKGTEIQEFQNQLNTIKNINKYD